MKCEVILWWSDEDGRFLAEIPELPGCLADGETKEEALKAVEEVARLWIEEAERLGREVPDPKARLRYA